MPRKAPASPPATKPSPGSHRRTRRPHSSSSTTGDRRKKPTSAFSRSWCCTFPPAGPGTPDPRPAPKRHPKPQSPLPKRVIDHRRILSPGRVSPLPQPVDTLPEPAKPPAGGESGVFDAKGLDLKVCLKGKDGEVLVMEVDSRVMCESSSYFAKLVLGSRSRVVDSLVEFRRIEVGGVADLGVFRETIELMYEKDPTRRLMKAGVSRAIDILEVSSTIKFERGVMSCMKFIEAVPWTESEEEKLISAFMRCKFNEEVSRDVLARLRVQSPSKSDDLAIKLIQSVASGTNSKARKELQSLVNVLLSKTSVHHKDLTGLNKESLYKICHSCLKVLLELFKEASESGPVDENLKGKETKPLLERISKQVENLNWLLEILIGKHIAEDFVCLWANQTELIAMHERASPMVRYELSRISASVFIALGKGKVQCKGEIRSSALIAWFKPMLTDFGWLQRCSKGLDMRTLEESLGQALLTLPMKQQQSLFLEWFRCFSSKGTECPNLSKAFQVWWRRSFARTSETRG